MKRKTLRAILCYMLSLALLITLQTYASASTLPYTDVSITDGYYKAIEYCYDHNIMMGTSPTTFSPGVTLTRAMMVTILYRISGSNLQIAPTGFTDVPSGTYYYYAVGWAQSNGIVNGVTPTSFAPNDTLTREQSITMFYRYATLYEGYSYSLVNNSRIYYLQDYSSVSVYARAAVNWGLNSGVIDTDTITFYPSVGTSRRQCAQYIYCFLTKVLGDGKSFSDTSLSPGSASSIANELATKGYQACLGYDLNPQEMYFAMKNSKVLFTHSHGENDRIILGGSNLTSSTIQSNSISNCYLAYISACNAGNTFVQTLYYTGGAKAVVGFTSTISANTATNGIHYFNYCVFYFLNQGYDIHEAVMWAQSNIYLNYNDYYGSDSVVIKGNYT